MKLFFTLLVYEWRSLQRQAYSWVLPLAFFIFAASLFLWIPQNIDDTTRQTSLWITLFFALTLATKDVFLDQAQQGTLILLHNLQIPPVYIFWSKWASLSVLCIVFFTPPLLFLAITGQNTTISLLHLGTIAPLSIALFILINLSNACLFAKKIKKNATFLTPILSIPLSIPALLFTIQASITPFFSSSSLLLLSMLLFSFPALSAASAASLGTLKKD